MMLTNRLALLIFMFSFLLMGFTVEGPDIPGIAGSLEHSSEQAPTQVLLVHGMGIHKDSDWSQKLRGELAEELKLKRESCSHHEIQNDQSSYPADNLPASLNICSYKNGIKKLIFYELTWSMITEPVKKRVLGYDDEYGKDRASINGETKKAVINEGLSDAILYLSRYRPVLQRPFRQAICIVLQGIPPSQGQDCALSSSRIDSKQGKSLFIITKSLGSAILYDTLKEMKYAASAESSSQAMAENAEMRAASSFVGNTNTVFMLANQIPLLCLGVYSANSRVCEESEKALERVPTTTQVVAISDTNDLLSYPLKDWQLDFVRLPGSVTNVHVTLATSWLGKIANPKEAHTGHENDSDVIRMIACGTKEHKLRDCQN
jgi:hypothetical protein